jgi:hypothetical protein
VLLEVILNKQKIAPQRIRSFVIWDSKSQTKTELKRIQEVFFNEKTNIQVINKVKSVTQHVEMFINGLWCSFETLYIDPYSTTHSIAVAKKNSGKKTSKLFSKTSVNNMLN